ncbi:hypothetical protein AB0I22_37110 [Streptomyces sp. NPDC050610]
MNDSIQSTEEAFDLDVREVSMTEPVSDAADPQTELCWSALC